MKHLVSWIAVVALALGISSSALAQTRITLLTPDPIKADVDKLVQQFEAKTGDKVQVSYGTGVGTRRTVAEGGALDVTLLFAPFDEVLKTGNIDKKTQTVVARLRLAIAVKKGPPNQTSHGRSSQNDAAQCKIHRFSRSDAGKRWRSCPPGSR